MYNGCRWKDAFLKHFAKKMMSLGYTPWFVGEKTAEFFDFLFKENEQTKKGGTE